ncbi:MAG: FAD-dependent oxidoreductase [Alphaproteobacteria bacterium]|nr:FAD-dependent oxidoreductase [Alphaproteobacteria bacterium]MBV9372832.1 FAD-dependent oxidoreductase [Alphaproteobacteria bacterium]MBV9900473.1 FAD-dependent oxidoreductase [Alphaproteobacteria bacterium]
MDDMSRRTALKTGAATLAGGLAGPATGAARGPEVVVVGAGVFGAWTARHLQRLGRRVLLLDAWGPAHARASSGGESRLTRGSYGADEIYTRFAWESLAEWKSLSSRAGLPILHQAGVLFFFPTREDYVARTIEVHRRLALPTEVLERAAMARRFPQIDFEGIEIGLYEPAFGALMARRAVQTLVAEFVAAGGEYRRAAVAPPEAGEGPLERIILSDGTALRAARFVFACGPWLPKLFPSLLGSRIFPTRQEVFFFAPPAGGSDFQVGRLPGWADFNGGDIFYGFPDLEGRGFKIAHDAHGPPMDPDGGDRIPSPAALAEVRAFMERRFPAMRGRPLSEARVCQYENSANGDFLVDFHPSRPNVLLVGAGSGHGFKHGPAVGRYAAALLEGRLAHAEPRFALAAKSERQNRAVH